MLDFISEAGAPQRTKDELGVVSTGGGSKPRWSRDGKELFFVDTSASGSKLMSAAVTIMGGSFKPSRPEPLFDLPALEGLIVYDVSPDGRFLFAVPNQQGQRINPITLVQNWQAGLKK